MNTSDNIIVPYPKDFIDNYIVKVCGIDESDLPLLWSKLTADGRHHLPPMAETQKFLRRVRSLNLDPLSSEVHLLHKRSTHSARYKFITLIGIDGLRSAADSTGNYCPGSTPTSYTYDDSRSRVISATVYIARRYGPEWREFSETAFFSEYVQRRHDGSIEPMWLSMPAVMLAKCAEARALRRGFPSLFSNIYEPAEISRTDVYTPVDTSGLEESLGKVTPVQKQIKRGREATDILSATVEQHIIKQKSQESQP